MIPHYVHIKNGKPTLVLIHGLLSSLATFIPLIPLLENSFDLLLVDQRGHGKTPPLGTDYSAKTMAEDLKNLLDHLNIKTAFILGHSMGGRTALMFGALYPKMVKKMIIEDMGIHQRQEQSSEKDLEREELAKKVFVPSLFFTNKDDILKVISPLYSYANDLMKTKVIEHDSSKFELKFWPDVSVRYGYQGNNTDLTFTLKKSSFPVLFLVADPEVGSALTPSCIEHIKTHIPRAKLQLIEKSWHTIHKTHPEEFSQAIILFLLD